MTVAFVSLSVAILQECIPDCSLERALLPALLLGAASVPGWHTSGDLRTMSPQPRARPSARMRSRTGITCAADGESVSFKELLESWRTGAAAPRTAQSYTVRLPVDDAARLAALADMFPGRAPEQLITELLGQALQELAAAMPYVAGKRVISTDEQGDPLYEDEGPMPRFMELAREHAKRLEAAGAPAARVPRKRVLKKRSRARR